jgi:signal transduction histidine kinase
VGAIVESALDDFRRLAARDGLSLELRRPQGRVSAAVDPYYLERICMPLCSNAVKFAEDGGVTATARRRAGAVEVSFEDTGVGIPTEFLPNLYDEFAQASSGDDRTHEGNGLGLTITRRLVEGWLGGQIQIESVEGEGTRVMVQLPAESPSDEAEIDPEGPAVA